MIRLFDIFSSSLSLIFLSPLFIIVISILKFTGEGEVFFYQERIGKNNVTFKLIKFVTMLKDSPNIGTKTITIHNDPRILPFGHFLRKTKINELPQLLNIFKGDMSLIGARPLTNETISAYSEEERNFIFSSAPGLSGIGSVIFRNEESILKDHKDNILFYNSVISPYKAKLEVWYIKKKNLILYFTLIALTIYVVLVPNSSLVWKIFKDLPKSPKELESII